MQLVCCGRPRKRQAKYLGEFVIDVLPSYKKAHAEVFTAKNLKDKHSTHLSDADPDNKKHNNNVQERFNDRAQFSEAQARDQK